jgi:NitT/TauT family transport system substrate-binding protein
MSASEAARDLQFDRPNAAVERQSVNLEGRLMSNTIARRQLLAAVAGALVLAAVPAAAQDKVKVGVFPVSSSLPYFVAVERGFFKEQNIEPEMVRLIGGPPNVAAMITNQIDASAVLVTIEGMNADLKKPGVAMYISLNSQNKTYQMEQFVVRKDHPATSLKDLKGAKIMSAPGPANVTMAKAALAAAGLKEGEYTIDQLDMARHV